jgi:hypothetical protein
MTEGHRDEPAADSEVQLDGPAGLDVKHPEAPVVPGLLDHSERLRAGLDARKLDEVSIAVTAERPHLILT